MGIQGLLPLLKSIHKPCHLKHFSGQTLAVDAYGWLHRGAIACAIDLAQAKPTRKWLDFVMHRVRMLQHFNVTPYLVFDGDYLPSKSATEKDRATRRRESRTKGLEFLRLGKSSLAQAELQKSIDVTPEMARQLIDELKKLCLPYIVAPYEADSQMVFLERCGLVNGIISEDSDLLVFGARCLLTKLDQYGECIMINRDDFTACREISLVGWSDADFRLMAILNGCDYLAGIEKMGLKTAYRLIRKHKTLDRIIRSVQFEGKIKVPPGYLESFASAEATFLYQWVYCPQSRCLVNFSEPAPDVDLAHFPCIGHHVEANIAAAVAVGDLHPHTKQPLCPPKISRNTFQHGARNRAQVLQTPDLKKHKSIDSFFKPQRTPLAELDPNSFTPSPSQQRLLQRGPASWSADSARRPSLLSRAVSSAHAPQHPQRHSADRSRNKSSSPKRQRLCSDGSYVSTPSTPTERVESGTSKFFKHATLSKGSVLEKIGNSSKDEFNLWSDDSIEQAMSLLPGTTEQGSSTRSTNWLTIYHHVESPGVLEEVIDTTAETPFTAGHAYYDRVKAKKKRS
ncbi:PIN domain-like protein [Aureobasidium namibiae CBS 147.97]|uniref:PIN domain-like protein n=1 Tax=Aureobasidium namibiae CBS 147.97 TaxID=1043004 RepID=A0A074WH94_9PEZI|nr:PIN domain-like protein [Aureobasidium namibiae CBS 147.97]KEQ69192.1 PIN domain-like protein [Aureobasidium namibiae CBS 147.97]